MTSRADEIRQKMSRVRADIDDDVDELVEGAKSLVDWRDYVRKQPLISLGVAFALGFVVIPKRQKIVQTDAASVAKMLGNEKLVVAPGANVQQKKSWSGSLLATLAGTALRTAVLNLGQQAATAIAAKQGMSAGSNRSPVGGGAPLGPRSK